MTESQQPNPFSREGSSRSDGLGSEASAGEGAPAYQPPGAESNQPPAAESNPPPGPDSDQEPDDGSKDRHTQDWPSYSTEDPYTGPAVDPYGRPALDPYGRPASSYGSPSGSSTYGGPGLDYQSMPSYGDPGQGYGESPYGSPYEANPYQTSFGGVSPYGAVPTPPATPHPQAALALTLGILGTVLGLFCILPGLIGIGGIVLGRRVKNEIDADPGRYTGRSQATAAIITGIIGVSICALATLFIVLAIIAGIASTGI